MRLLGLIAPTVYTRSTFKYGENRVFAIPEQTEQKDWPYLILRFESESMRKTAVSKSLEEQQQQQQHLLESPKVKRRRLFLQPPSMSSQRKRAEVKEVKEDAKVSR